ncbi:Peroxisomal acyl-coenzyme A oxidase 1 [Modicella reniformis]|uniref:Peroxisomal acyl-coenzyme A oxidase 1 n=1 Tax=Modicella reniformis TaxID=1440133 RepID=A0A9P6SUG2_9FUNG|nr:Peroxisomal acyl-coenzyme A oxidase 1 [Modicella reniformis]
MLATGNKMRSMYESMLEELMKGDVSSLAEVHAISSGLKSTCTTMAATNMEDCRKLMGGHGYSYFSGISHLWASYVPSNTYEGDNFLLTQQSARYLLKQIKDATTEPEKPEMQLAAFEHRAGRLVADLAATAMQDGVVWSDLNLECWRLNHAHSQYVLARSAVEGVAQAKAQGRSAETIAVLKRLSDLFALHSIQASLGDYLEDYFISPRQCQLLRQQIKDLQAALADDVVGLVDAFDFPDHYVNSALGSADGNVYQRLWDAAQREEINHRPPLFG